MRLALLLPVILLAACYGPPEASAGLLAPMAPITTDPAQFLGYPSWQTPENQRSDLSGDVTRQWSIQAVVVEDLPDRLTAQGLPIPGEAPRVVTELGRIEGREVFGGVSLGATEGHPRVIESSQVRQRTFIADYKVRSQKPLPVLGVLIEGDFFQANLTQQGPQSYLTSINIRINRLMATTRATIHCRSGHHLRIEEPLLAAADGTSLAAPLPLGNDPVIIAIPLRWTLLRPTAQARAWGTTVEEVTVPSASPVAGEALVAIILLRPVAQPNP
jgi:hypothetical protein